MKKSTIVSALLVSTFMLGATPTTVLADQVAASKTDATVKFQSESTEADGGGTTLDPTNPEGEGIKPDPGEGSESTKGPLRIDFAPNFKFGTVTMSGNAADYNPLYPKVSLLDKNGELTDPLQEKYVPHYVQVTDNRGTNEGWELAVSATPFNGTINPDADLKATLTVSNAQLTTSVKPVDGKDFKPATLNRNITLSSEPEVLIKADADQGMGSWVAMFTENPNEELTVTDRNPNITLHVPADSKKDAAEEYKSTITWTLSSTPTSTN
ncbi:WxL domain-containing protein [Enterococcus crotali]|uniref:WxL domain-containing protein n=1 Tax=Enterococcus crotali TaxID=1453587 RepID=UPI000472832D|nr:WxL domain-containing protein [Enterococcus crotali]OTP53486.1 hypothetical protein A5881_000383 [Enterococcus termitis]